jgi:hypothetical protein
MDLNEATIDMINCRIEQAKNGEKGRLIFWSLTSLVYDLLFLIPALVIAILNLLLGKTHMLHFVSYIIREIGLYPVSILLVLIGDYRGVAVELQLVAEYRHVESDIDFSYDAILERIRSAE